MKLESIHKVRNNLLVAILGAFAGGIFHNYFVKEFSVGPIESVNIFSCLFALLAIVTLEIYREKRLK